jgi:outer membrane lipoprotein carrier protein
VRSNFEDNAPLLRCVNPSVKAFALLWMAIVPVLAVDSATQHLLKAVESRYNRAQTLEVRFAETYSGLGRGPRTETGVLYLRKPGRMRWEYTQPAGKLFVSDGKQVYLYLPGENRVEKMKLKDTEDMRAPLAFLLGKLNFEKEFQNLQARTEADGSLVTAEPKSDSLPYSKVEFLVSATFEIRKLHIVGQDQSVLDFAFESEKLNPPLANSMFQFQPPAGAEVVESGSGQD